MGVAGIGGIGVGALSISPKDLNSTEGQPPFVKAPSSCLHHLKKDLHSALQYFCGRLISNTLAKNLWELADRIRFIFSINLHHLIPVAIAGLACFIPVLIHPGISVNIAMISAIGSIATALSYFSYKLMESWNLYPYDFIKKIEYNKEIIDRPAILNRISYYLSKPEDNNVLVVGEPGCGKTTLAQALANRIHRNSQDPLKEYDVYYLNLDGLHSVDQPFGHFEKKFLEVIKILKSQKRVILFIDEAHRLFHFANGSPLSDRLKPYQGLRIFGVTTPHEYKTHFLKDWSFDQRFNKIKINGMNRTTSLKLLQNKYPQVDPKTVKYIFNQSKKLHPEQAQPRCALQLFVNVIHRHPNVPLTKECVDETVAFEKKSLRDLLQASL